MAEDPSTGAAERTDDPIADLRAAVGLGAAAQPFQRRRALESLTASAARLLSSLIPARDRLRAAYDALDALPYRPEGAEWQRAREEVFQEAKNMLTALGNAQQASEVPSPDRIPGIGEARDNLQAAIVHFNGRGGTRDGASRAVTMRDAALDLLHALRIKFGSEGDVQQPSVLTHLTGLEALALADLLVQLEGYVVHGRRPLQATEQQVGILRKLLSTQEVPEPNPIWDTVAARRAWDDPPGDRDPSDDPKACPYCAFRASTAEEEIQHMTVQHPNIVRDRRIAAGVSPQEAESLALKEMLDAPAPDTGGEPTLGQIKDVNDVIRADFIARRFHEVYEQLAPQYGYDTRVESRVPFDSLGSDLRLLMRNTIQCIVAEGTIVPGAAVAEGEYVIAEPADTAANSELESEDVFPNLSETDRDIRLLSEVLDFLGDSPRARAVARAIERLR